MINLLGFFKCGRGHSEEDLLFVLPGVGNEFDASELTNFDLVCTEDGEGIITTLISIPHGVPGGGGRLIDVEFSEGFDMPRAFTVDQVEFEIDKIEAMIRLPRHRPPPQLLEDTLSKSFGIYLINTGQVRCVIEARPHKEPDGQEDWSNPQWYLIDMDKSGVVYDFVEVSKQRSEPGKMRGKLAQIKDTGVPINNIKAYKYLYRLENHIREFVTSKLKEKYPDQGWKGLLPEDIRNDIKEKLNEASKNPWFSSKGPDDPMSYTTFGQLRKIIEEKKEAFKDLFGSKNMAILLGNLAELELFRNKVAHNRKLGSKEFKQLEQTARATYEAVGKRG